jgi:tRNA-2-methylthio-N6-dimethylallyladenosine synthase
MHKEIIDDRQGEVFISSLENFEDKIHLPSTKKFYIESYGCAMNFADSEVVASILQKEGYHATPNFLEADLILVNTCSIRENAEQKVRTRLGDLKKVKETNPEALIGVLGCMAERLKEKFLEQDKIVDLVVGPDAYRSLPQLISSAGEGNRLINVLLSREETYADISPVRLNSNGITAFISITRGCNNMCSFCVVPFTRGRERSRDASTIVNEAIDLFDKGYREVTLLGQNVDSYYWNDEAKNESVTFAQLLEKVALINPNLRVRFSTSHPKDISDEVIYTIKNYKNICDYIHLPVQSGSTSLLEKMNRTYTREWYLERVSKIREVIPDCGLSTDIIAGFCSETEQDHEDTLSLMELVQYDMAYMYKYSERPGTLAARKYKDDIDEATKSRRLTEIVDKQMEYQLANNLKEIGNVYEVLIEGISKKSDEHYYGRNSQNKVIIFPKGNYKLGNYVNVKVKDVTRTTLIADLF